MRPRIVGNPLIAWRDDTTLQIGWGTHSVVVEGAPSELTGWLRLIDGSRSRDELLAAAARSGIPGADAEGLLDDLAAANLTSGCRALRVGLQPCGLLEQPLTRALRDCGVDVSRGADVLVFPQGQVPSLVTCPPGARRIVPVWFGVHAVHVGPVLDRDFGPCPLCVDAAWSHADPSWPMLVAQAGSVPTWTHPAQIQLAAAAVSLIADAPDTVGLEMILDAMNPGPRWRVWSVHPRCSCQQEAAAAG